MLTFREKILRNLLEGENVGALVQTPQDGRQGTKKLKHVLSKREGTARETRKRCVSCYSKMKEERGAKAARTKLVVITADNDNIASEDNQALIDTDSSGDSTVTLMTS
ncbi:uncharacterized protein LOC124372529 [Homalodisca vitripennis]|uniref:uncharacterized protein LOC124372529 n=1 Tax=Homalodisca vitripennis TaxID=197043 RepID=UPI001EEC35D4|nr:uncharacterized protein LOC124372529 [Homalodisca vitripennis]